VISCPNGHTAPDGTQFCGICGEDMQSRCPDGHLATPGDLYCETCGKPVAVGDDLSTALVAEPRRAAPQPRARKTAHAAAARAATTTLPTAPPPPQPAVVQHRAVAAAADPGVAPAYHFVFKRLTVIDQITAVSSAVLLIALFMPWFAATGEEGGSFHLGGINAHEYLAFAVLTAVVLVAYLAARAGWDRLPVRLPVAHAPLLLVLSVVQLVLVLIAFFSTPLGLGHAFGGWLALIAALGACLPVAVPAVQSFQRTTL
jgi:hypothetical protein